MEEKNTQTIEKEVDTLSETQPTTHATDGVTSASSSTTVKAVVVIVVLGLVALGVWYFMNTEQDATAPLTQGTEGAAELTPEKEYPEIVAIVNGTEVTGTEMTASYQQIAQVAIQQGANPADPAVQTEIESQALDTLVNTTLLLQASQAAGNSAADEVVANKFTELEAQYGGPEAFAKVISDSGYTLDEVEKDIHNQIVIDAYLQTEANLEGLTVSDAEVQEMYDSFAAGSADMPSLEELYSNIEEQLLTQKQQEAVNQVIADLRAKAEIETLI